MVSGFRFGLPKAHNEFAIASLLLGAAGALAVMVAIASDGFAARPLGDPPTAEMAIELARRFALLAAPCALLATVLGAIGTRRRFSGARLSRGGLALGLVVLIECAALALGWVDASGLFA